MCIIARMNIDFTSFDAPITIGTVALTVANLDASLSFYEERLGLRLHERQGKNVAVLGVGEADLLRLEERRGARKALRATGLYHFALLLPTRVDLALALRHFAQSETVLSGMADHAVSEAIYLSDPDGHGIEIYRDRPRQEWQYPNGQLKLTTEPFDVAGVFDELLGMEQAWAGLPPGTTMGHIHLHVAHIAPVETFYRDVIGLDLVTRYGDSATFMSSGGYHHHLGANTWNGVGASPPPVDALGLQWFTLQVQPSLLPEIMMRLETAVIPTTPHDNGWLLHDPSGNPILLTAH